MRGDRLEERRKAHGLSQAGLAKEVGLTQQAIGKLEAGTSRETPKLAKIARRLTTTAAYLDGETDDPAGNAPPPEPRYQLLTLPVALPSESVLTQMFRGVLLASEALKGDALARELARQLPRALGLARGPLIELDLPDPQQEAADDPDVALPERQRARRR